MLALKSYHRVRGFSLIEMMIAVTVGLVVLAGVAQIFASTVNSSGDSLKMARVNQDLRAAMDVMIRDIQRAGYSALTTNSTTGAVTTRTNPFTSSTTNLQVTGSCITYTYDRNANGTLDNDENMAFYLSNGAILMRNSVTSASNSCSPTSAEGITDSNRVTITALTFTVTPHCINVTNSPPTDCAATAAANGNILVKPRQVTISITGTPVGDASTLRTITDTVKLRNDLVCIAPC